MALVQAAAYYPVILSCTTGEPNNATKLVHGITLYTRKELCDIQTSLLATTGIPWEMARPRPEQHGALPSPARNS